MTKEQAIEIMRNFIIQVGLTAQIGMGVEEVLEAFDIIVESEENNG